ncbi:MAG: hypothetical protein VKP70_00435 [Cyanobacteriota bacterium]|nr:hypothetical protein [Cyanobacteriota bacterium]
MVVLPHRSSRRALVVTALAALPLGWAAAPAPGLSQQSGYGQTLGTSPQEQQIYNYDPSGRPSSAGGLNPANPLDLINKIRKGTAMDDATPPGDAIDQALKELEAQSRPQPVGTAAATP